MIQQLCSSWERFLVEQLFCDCQLLKCSLALKMGILPLLTENILCLDSCFDLFQYHPTSCFLSFITCLKESLRSSKGAASRVRFTAVKGLGRRTWTPDWVVASSSALTTNLELFLGRPLLNSSVLLVNTQLVFLPPVGFFQTYYVWNISSSL